MHIKRWNHYWQTRRTFAHKFFFFSWWLNGVVKETWAPVLNLWSNHKYLTHLFCYKYIWTHSCVLQVPSKTLGNYQTWGIVTSMWQIVKKIHTHTHTSCNIQIGTPPNGIAMLLRVGLFVKVFERVKLGFQMSFRGGVHLTQKAACANAMYNTIWVLATLAHCPMHVCPRPSHIVRWTYGRRGLGIHELVVARLALQYLFVVWGMIAYELTSHSSNIEALK